MKILLILSIISILFAFTLPKPYQSYIDKHLHKAKMLQHSTGVPVSIQFAQAIIESGAGRSNIAVQANNHFGIRCGDNWQGERYYSKSGCWRAYKNVGLSFVDHACFLQNHYPHVCFKTWEEWTKLEGYGESGYWKKIGRIIERYKLYKYDIKK